MSKAKKQAGKNPAPKITPPASTTPPETTTPPESTTPPETTTPGPDAEEIKPSVIDLKAAAEFENAKPTEAPEGITEEAIKEKLRFGLSRKQAIEILQSQAAHDAELAKAEKNKGKA